MISTNDFSYRIVQSRLKRWARWRIGNLKKYWLWFCLSRTRRWAVMFASQALVLCNALISFSCWYLFAAFKNQFSKESKRSMRSTFSNFYQFNCAIRSSSIAQCTFYFCETIYEGTWKMKDALLMPSCWTTVGVFAIWCRSFVENLRWKPKIVCSALFCETWLDEGVLPEQLIVNKTNIYSYLQTFT